MVVVWGECGRGVVDIGCRDNVMDEAGREWSLGGRKNGGTGNRASGVDAAIIFNISSSILLVLYK